MNKILPLMIFILGCNPPNKCTEKQMIISVGGCDRYGNCGAVTDGGRKVVRSHPVVFEEIEVNVECK